MSAPPSPPYPKPGGLPCGDQWDMVGLVTGEIYGQGGFGKEYQRGLSPLAAKEDLTDIGSDRVAQEALMVILDAKIDELRVEVDDNSGAGGTRRFLTGKEEKSILWLLDHAEAELDTSNDIWEKWKFRNGGTFPLDFGDNVTNIPGGYPGCAGKFGKTISVPNRTKKLKCPTKKELKERPKDRAAIKQRFEWALMHIRCAEWGLYRVLLYKEALAAWKGKDFPTKIPTPAEAPPLTGPGGFKAPMLPEPDLCKELGIGCPVDLELPPTPEGEVPVCPDDFCLDPDGLPPPDQIDDGVPDGQPTKPTKPKKEAKKKKYVTGKAVAITGAAALGLFGLYKVATASTKVFGLYKAPTAR